MRLVGWVALFLVVACGGAKSDKVDKIDKNLVGNWALDKAAFVRLELLADGTFRYGVEVVCVTDPCPSRVDAGTWRSTDFSSATKGKLHLDADGKSWAKYDVELTRRKPRELRLRNSAIDQVFKSTDD